MGREDTNGHAASRAGGFDRAARRSVRFPPSMNRISLGLGLAIGCLAAISASAQPTAATIVARAAGGANAPLVLRDGNRLVVEQAGASETLDLPAGTQIGQVVALGSDWLVTGVTPDDRGADLVIVRGSGGQAVRLPSPPGRQGDLREGSVAFGDGSRLVGLAWVEGAERRQYEVRYSPWQGDAFGAPELISPRGPGSQLALAGTRLSDGRLLLVWAGFDGTDDEIWGAVRSESGWSKPVRVGVDNSVPDILPTVSATADGARIAWSRFDADSKEYRLAGGRFDAGGFHDDGFLAPPGTMYPTFERSTAGPALLYLDARGDEWVFSEVDADGKLGRSARTPVRGDERPQVSAGARGVSWRFAQSTETSGWR
jgi:hypothetical protein